MLAICDRCVGDDLQPADSCMVAGDLNVFKAPADGYGSLFNTFPAAVGAMVWPQGLFGSVRLPYDVVRLA